MSPSAHPDEPAPDPAGGPTAKPLGFAPLLRATCLAVLAIVALGAAALPWLLSDRERLSAFVARLVPDLQADVTIGRASIGWSGPIVFEDIKVVPRSAARPPLSVRRIESSHGLAAILLSAGDLGRLRVEGLEADVIFNTDRTSNLTGLVAPPAELRGAVAAAPGPRKSPVRMRIDVDDAIARVTGPWAAETWVSDPTDIAVALGPLPDGSGSAWTIDSVQLLRDARLEANVAQGVLAYIAPILADAARSSGRFSLRIDGATFPVGAPEAARLAGVLSMHEVDLGPGPLAARTMASLPGRLELPTSIRVADDANVEFHLANRRIWHKGLEFGLPLAKPGQRLDIHSSGSVGLDDGSLDVKLELPLPADLPPDRPLVAALAGKSISLGIGGVLGEPTVDFNGSIRATAGEVVSDLLDRLRNPGQPAPARPPVAPAPKWLPPERDPADAAPRTPPASAQPAGAADAATDRRPQTATEKLKDLATRLPPEATKDPGTTDAIIDLVGGVLDEVAKRRAERAAAQADEAQPGPPGPARRGGRLLRRLAPPPAPADPGPAPSR